MMGVGLWTSEEIKFHPETGALLTKNTWVRLCMIDRCSNYRLREGEPSFHKQREPHNLVETALVKKYPKGLVNTII